MNVKDNEFSEGTIQIWRNGMVAFQKGGGSKQLFLTINKKTPLDYCRVTGIKNIKKRKTHDCILTRSKGQRRDQGSGRPASDTQLLFLLLLPPCSVRSDFSVRFHWTLPPRNLEVNEEQRGQWGLARRREAGVGNRQGRR